MDDNISRIQKPLAIVALFAGIVQISGIAVLPYIKLEYQSQLIWFLISFPVLMVILFFITINYYIRTYVSKNDYLTLPNSGRKFKPSTRYEIEQPIKDSAKAPARSKTSVKEEPIAQRLSKTLTRNEAAELTGEKFMRVESAAVDKITWK